jgi:hypothetical protein
MFVCFLCLNDESKLGRIVGVVNLNPDELLIRADEPGNDAYGKKKSKTLRGFAFLLAVEAENLTGLFAFLFCEL